MKTIQHHCSISWIWSTIIQGKEMFNNDKRQHSNKNAQYITFIALRITCLIWRIVICQYTGGSVQCIADLNVFENFKILQVLFSFKLGWVYNQGPGCTPALIGSLVTGMSSSFWKCTSGCNSVSQDLSNVNYICTGASITENWEQGERTFTYTFPGEGPFVVE